MKYLRFIFFVQLSFIPIILIALFSPHFFSAPQSSFLAAGERVKLGLASAQEGSSFEPSAGGSSSPPPPTVSAPTPSSPSSPAGSPTSPTPPTTPSPPIANPPTTVAPTTPGASSPEATVPAQPKETPQPPAPQPPAPPIQPPTQPPTLSTPLITPPGVTSPPPPPPPPPTPTPAKDSQPPKDSGQPSDKAAVEAGKGLVGSVPAGVVPGALPSPTIDPMEKTSTIFISPSASNTLPSFLATITTTILGTINTSSFISDLVKEGTSKLQEPIVTLLTSSMGVGPGTISALLSSTISSMLSLDQQSTPTANPLIIPPVPASPSSIGIFSGSGSSGGGDNPGLANVGGVSSPALGATVVTDINGSSVVNGSGGVGIKVSSVPATNQLVTEAPVLVSASFNVPQSATQVEAIINQLLPVAVAVSQSAPTPEVVAQLKKEEQASAAATTPQAQVDLAIQFADKKSEAIHTLVSNLDSESTKVVVDRLNTNLDTAVAKIATLPPQARKKANQALRDVCAATDTQLRSDELLGSESVEHELEITRGKCLLINSL